MGCMVDYNASFDKYMSILGSLCTFNDPYICIPYFCAFISYSLSPFPGSLASSFITLWMLYSHSDNNHLLAVKVLLFFFFPSSLDCSSSMAWLCVYCSCVVLQAQQVWPRFGSPSLEPDGFMTLVLHAWLTCQMQVSKAQSDWFSLSLSLTGFLA